MLTMDSEIKTIDSIFLLISIFQVFDNVLVIFFVIKKKLFFLKKRNIT